jgi:hypothetical protein
VANLVVGIFPQSDPKAIEAALSAQNVDLTKVKVVTSGVDADEAEASLMDFFDVEQAMESNSLSDSMTEGTGVLEQTGTAVPGIGGAVPSLSSLTVHEAFTSHFGGIAIPDDEVDNFNEAVEYGRAVVAYPDPSDEAATAAAFKAAGLLNVRAY